MDTATFSLLYTLYLACSVFCLNSLSARSRSRYEMFYWVIRVSWSWLTKFLAGGVRLRESTGGAFRECDALSHRTSFCDGATSAYLNAEFREQKPYYIYKGIKL